MAQLTKREIKDLETLHQSLSDYRTHIKILEQNFIEKLAISENTVQRIRGSIIELEILVTGILKVYCTGHFKERSRIEYIFQSLLSEFETYETRMRVNDKSVRNFEEPHSVLVDSLGASSFSERNAMLNMKNEAKELIGEYKSALSKIKEQNSTIQTMIEERGKSIIDTVKSHTGNNRYFTNDTDITLDPKKSIDRFEKHEPQFTTSPTIYKPTDSSLGKYAEINNFIEDLNKKKEENINRLLNIENRIHVMRNSYGRDEGELRTTDLSKDYRRSPTGSAEKFYAKRVFETAGTEPSIESGIKTKSGLSRNPSDREYLNYRTALSSREQYLQPGPTNHRRQSDTFMYTGSEQNTNSKRKKSISKPKDQKFVHGEIRQLDHEIQIISNLIDSALLQQKYQGQ